MINIDKKEFEKIDRKFKNYASRLIRSSEMDFIEKLEVFLNFVDECDLLKVYVNSKNNKEFDIETILSIRDGWNVKCFDISSNEEEKVSFVYQLLKYYLTDETVNLRDIYILYNGETNYNEALRLFNKHVTQALVNCINDYLDERRIDMQEDGVIKIEINGDKSQVNVGSGNSVINANQNNNESNNNEVKNMLNYFLEHLKNSGIDEGLKEHGEGVVTEATEEFTSDNPKKYRIQSAIGYLKSLITMTGLSKDLLLGANQLIETLSTGI